MSDSHDLDTAGSSIALEKIPDSVPVRTVLENIALADEFLEPGHIDLERIGSDSDCDSEHTDFVHIGLENIAPAGTSLTEAVYPPAGIYPTEAAYPPAGICRTEAACSRRQSDDYVAAPTVVAGPLAELACSLAGDSHNPCHMMVLAGIDQERAFEDWAVDIDSLGLVAGLAAGAAQWLVAPSCWFHFSAPSFRAVVPRLHRQGPTERLAWSDYLV